MRNGTYKAAAKALLKMTFAASADAWKSDDNMSEKEQGHYPLVVDEPQIACLRAE
jgi:hypothetical protein